MNAAVRMTHEMVARSPEAAELLGQAEARHTRGGVVELGARDVLKVNIPDLGAALSVKGWLGRVQQPAGPEFFAKAPHVVQAAVRHALASGEYTVSIVTCFEPTHAPMSAWAPDFRSTK